MPNPPISQAKKQGISRYINLPMAVTGAVLLSGIVFYINFPHGYLPASTAALKQACYTFFFAGFVTRLNQKLSLLPGSNIQAIAFASFLSSTIAISVTFIIHCFKGTPEPIYSTLPTAIIAPFGFFILAYRERSSYYSNIKTIPTPT